MNTTYISPGNRKTGDNSSFDITPVGSCPGSTEECRSKCYAVNLMKAYTNVRNKYERNFEFSQTDEFVPHMVDNIPSGIMRIHVSGDLYSKGYVNKWIEIAKARPDVTFYLYTRSWRVRSMKRVILDLASLPNVTVNLSVDSETGRPTNLWKHLKWCYLTHDDKVPGWLRKTDLIFRSKHNGEKRRRKNLEKKGQPLPKLVCRLGRNSTTVCPKEVGKDIPLTCSQCGICIKKTVNDKEMTA
jgi:hypothetical protein